MRTFSGIAGLAATATLVAMPAPALATWSIVGVDPAAGEAGAAVASCIGVHIDDSIAAAGARGAAVTQALYEPRNHERVSSALLAGAGARELVREVTRRSLDDKLAHRQYAAVSMDTSAAAFTGASVPGASGDAQAVAASAQGNTLESRRVINATLDEFAAAARLPLAERLMRALEAGSAAGGDRRCNVRGVEQTASAAAIVVVRQDEVWTGGAPRGTGATRDAPEPWLHVRALTLEDRRNAVAILRDNLNLVLAARDVNVPAREPIAGVPEGDADAAPVVRSPEAHHAVRRALRLALGVLGLFGAAALILIALRRRQQPKDEL